MRVKLLNFRLASNGVRYSEFDYSIHESDDGTFSLRKCGKVVKRGFTSLEGAERRANCMNESFILRWIE